MGTFSRITLTSMFGTQLERPVLSQNDKTYRGRPRLQPVRCDQCIFFLFFFTFDPKWFNYCWMDTMASKSILYFSSFINCQQKRKKKKSKAFGLDFSPNDLRGEAKDEQETKLNNRRVVAACSYSFDSKFAFFMCFPAS